MANLKMNFARMSGIEPPPGLAPPPGLVPMFPEADQAAWDREDVVAAPIPVGLICRSETSPLDEKAIVKCDSFKGSDDASESEVTRTPSMDSQRSLDSSFDEILIAPSIGSFGHPEMCSRPCVYFTWGPCPKAAYCGFCHLAHRESIGKLDKRQRKIFQKLGEAEMIELLLPHMLERSKRFQSADDANEVLDVLARRLQDLAPTGDAIQSITTRKVDKLGYVLKQMPFHALASLIFARSDFDTDFLDDLTMATARLRAKLPAATSNDGSSLHWF